MPVICGNVCDGALKPFQWSLCLPAIPFVEPYCAETDSDPISETTPAVLSVLDTSLDADSASAYIEANDSLLVLLLHGKQHSVEMEATGSFVAGVEAGAPIPCLAEIAGGGMQVEDDLDDPQVEERVRKRWKENNVAKEMPTRCAEDAAGRATAE